MTNAGTNSTRCSACGGVHSPADSCPAAHGARVGTVLDGKYEIVRLLGHGGMGEVYEGRHTKIGRRVAVKFLHAQYAQHPEVARRFENEAKTAGAAEHENIAGVFDVGVLPDRSQFLVMEYLDGEDLDHVLRREGRLPLARAADVLVQACMGLDVVHRVGIVHRDLKPANLFVTRRASGADLVKVLDFGIAKLRRVEGDAGATKTGVALGTAYYMSPEQARGDRDIGTASDVYSLGVILYELLSGQRPHEGESLLQILHRILTQPPKPLEEVAPALPPAVYGIVRKAMAVDVAERFRGVLQLAEALAPFAAEARAPSQLPPSFATRAETAPAMGPAPAATPPASAPWAGVAVSHGTMVPVGQTSPVIPGVSTRKTAVIGFAIAGIFVVFVGAATLLVVGARAHRTGAVSSAAPAPSSSTPLPPPPVAAVSVAPPPVDTASESAPVTAEAASSSRTLPAPGPSSRPPPHAAGAARPSAATPPPALPAQPSCDPPYYYNAKGTRVFKPECL